MGCKSVWAYGTVGCKAKFWGGVTVDVASWLLDYTTTSCWDSDISVSPTSAILACCLVFLMPTHVLQSLLPNLH